MCVFRNFNCFKFLDLSKIFICCRWLVLINHCGDWLLYSISLWCVSVHWCEWTWSLDWHLISISSYGLYSINIVLITFWMLFLELMQLYSSQIAFIIVLLIICISIIISLLVFTFRRRAKRKSYFEKLL